MYTVWSTALVEKTKDIRRVAIIGEYLPDVNSDFNIKFIL